ncbi:MAG: GNAT family N-acetyltransferase [Pseudomonadota bacterium]
MHQFGIDLLALNELTALRKMIKEAGGGLLVAKARAGPISGMIAFTFHEEAVQPAPGFIQSERAFETRDPDGANIGLLSLFVEDAYRRRGLARGLVDQACSYADRKGCAAAIISHHEKNTAMAGLCEALGFKPRQRR